MKTKDFLSLLFIFIGITVQAQVTPFTMVVSPTDETCAGNGQIEIDIDGTQAGAEFEFAIYEMSDLNTPIRVVNGVMAAGATLEYTETALPEGPYHIIVTESFSGSSHQESADAMINSSYVPLAFTVDTDVECSGHRIEVQVTGGDPIGYTLLDAATNNPVFSQQASPTFTGVPNGEYLVLVEDSCGNSFSAP